jgi:hypothetical protein
MAETLATKVATLLDEALPDGVVLEQLLNELRQRTGRDGSATVMVNDVAVVVPMGATLTIVDKILFRETYESRFSTGCRVDVALGETQETGLGLLQPAYCFARLFFDRECRCMRIEFRSTIYRFSDDDGEV